MQRGEGGAPASPQIFAPWRPCVGPLSLTPSREVAQTHNRRISAVAHKRRECLDAIVAFAPAITTIETNRGNPSIAPEEIKI
jgi:hypothetical protein